MKRWEVVDDRGDVALRRRWRFIAEFWRGEFERMMHSPYSIRRAR